MKKIPYSRQSIDRSDVEAVIEALTSDFLTQGPAIEKFEADFATLSGSAHAVSLSNATVGLHLAYAALGVGPGRRVWTSPNTFVATSNAALYLGAEVDFVDIDPGTYNMDPGALTMKLERAEREGCLPDLVVPVHHSGQSCDMEAIGALARRYGFRVVEDASHAVGGVSQGSRIGGCVHSDACIFSFHPVKIITTGEGGMITTNNGDLAARLRLLRSHGITRDASLMTEPPHGPWYYQQTELGWNCRLTDIQAALGSSQLKRLQSFREHREKMARWYDEKLRALPLKTPVIAKGEVPSRHLYVIRVDSRRVRRSKKELFEELHRRGIMVNLHYIPVYLQPYYRSLGFRSGHCPRAEEYYAEAMSLPLYVSLTEEEQDVVVGELAAVLD